MGRRNTLKFFLGKKERRKKGLKKKKKGDREREGRGRDRERETVRKGGEGGKRGVPE